MNPDPLVPVYPQAPSAMVRALGSRVWDDEGRDYIDLTGGIAVCTLGHSHSELVRVLAGQARRLWHTSNFFATEPPRLLAEKLIEVSFADRVFFANSGAEAVEACVKMARRYFFAGGQSERNRVLVFDGAFHGRTALGIALGSKEIHRQGFGPLPGGIDRHPFNDPEGLEAAIGEQTAAVLVEPVQGEAGVLAATTPFLQQLRECCDSAGSLLIFDEVQSGNGRTGPLFAYMNSGVAPDLLATAKGLGNGLPIGAVLARQQVAEAMTIGSHGSTFGGNPLACAVALRTLELVLGEPVRANAAERSRQLAEGLAAIRQNTGLFSAVRCRGMLAGAVLADPAGGRLDRLLAACWRARVLALPAGNGDVLRLAPPLNITEQELRTGLWRLEQACRAEAQGAQP